FVRAGPAGGAAGERLQLGGGGAAAVVDAVAGGHDDQQRPDVIEVQLLTEEPGVVAGPVEEARDGTEIGLRRDDGDLDAVAPRVRRAHGGCELVRSRRRWGPVRKGHTSHE